MIRNWSAFGCADGQLKPSIDLMVLVLPKDLLTPSAFSPEWKKTVGTGKAVQCLLVLVVKATLVLLLLKPTGSIGYLNYGYVNGGKFQQVALQNRAGNFVKANAETLLQVCLRLFLMINFVVLTLTPQVKTLILSCP